MAWPKKNAAPVQPVDDEAAEGEMPMMPAKKGSMPMPAKKKAKGKMPPAGASKPAWRKIADQMTDEMTKK